MGGNRRQWDYPVLESGGEVAITDKEKSEAMAKVFVLIHSSVNLTEEGRRVREATERQHIEELERSIGMEDQPIVFVLFRRNEKRNR